jgi:hypothetical protein
MLPGQLKNQRFSPDTTFSQSRRSFLFSVTLTAAATFLRGSPLFQSLKAAAQQTSPDLLHDTLNGFLAFIVPGADAYSVNQGMSTSEAGALDANISDIFVRSLDQSAPYAPQFSLIVAGLLNQLAVAVNSAVTGPFTSPFANLKFSEKVGVLEIMDATPALQTLAGVLPALAAFLTYSEAGVLDSTTRSLTAQPVGWTISHYPGIADGRDEFLGYFDNRRDAERPGQ